VHPNAAGASAGAAAPDPRVLRTLLPQPSPMPAPQGDALPVARLSSSAYEDLRRCPYRFFALRQLKLQESDELENELSKRDFGNWLHCLLKHFHLTLQAIQASKDPQVPVAVDKLAMINVAADQATDELGLSPSEFLPFAAAWPKVRTGYLQWLEEHEATGATFLEAEVWKEMPLGDITLIGKLDRVDTQADGTPLVLDYKTEARTLTAERLKPTTQDTQIAFYGALISNDTLGAAYINLGEKEPSKTYNQPDIVHLRDQLIEGILSDTYRIAEGVGLRAMGEGKSCDFCAARGLCRKDFWSQR
jgi:ATP-dependent helicase/nuclease subunit B